MEPLSLRFDHFPINVKKEEGEFLRVLDKQTNKQMKYNEINSLKKFIRRKKVKCEWNFHIVSKIDTC